MTQQENVGGEKASRECPNCHSERNWKDGTRDIVVSSVQRFVCRECGYRFSDNSYKVNLLNENRQLCAKLEAKKLEPATETKTVADDTPTREAKGKLVQYVIWAQKEGLAETTITRRYKLLNVLLNRGTNLLDSESVKEGISKQKSWNAKTKQLAVEAYTSFLRASGQAWKAPKYMQVRKLPFLPLEREIDELIAGCNPKTTTFLQLLKETGARLGEAWQLEWISFDFENKSVDITPEKAVTQENSKSAKSSSQC